MAQVRDTGDEGQGLLAFVQEIQWRIGRDVDQRCGKYRSGGKDNEHDGRGNPPD